MDWSYEHLSNDVFTDVIKEESKRSKKHGLPFLESTKQLANWTRKAITTLLFMNSESYKVN